MSLSKNKITPRTSVNIKVSLLLLRNYHTIRFWHPLAGNCTSYASFCTAPSSPTFQPQWKDSLYPCCLVPVVLPVYCQNTNFYTAFLIALLAFCLGGSPSSRRLSLRSLRKDGDETMISDNESSPSVTFPWPTSLQNWRIQPNGYAIERWNSLPLMTFFYESGYRLWLPSALSPLSLYTPTRVSRIHDGFAYLANYPEGPKINSLKRCVCVYVGGYCSQS